MEKTSTFNVLKKITGKKISFVLCIVFTVGKALFYGWFFAYEVKKIMAAIATGEAGQLQDGMTELIFAVFLVALMNILYVRLKTRMINRVMIEAEDERIDSYNRHYCLSNDESGKLTSIQNTIPNLVNQSVEYVFGLIFLICVLTGSIVYGLTISIPIVLIGMTVSGVMVIITKRLGKNVQECAKESEDATNQVYGTLWEYNDNLEILPFLHERTAYAHLEAAIERENELKIRASKLTNMSRIFMRFSNIGTILLGGVLGGILIYFHKITAADLMALILLLPTISDHLFQIPGKINDYNGMKGMSAVLADFFGEEDRGITETDESQVEKISKIEWKNFSLPLWEQNPVEIGSFVMETGKVYGMYGPSGGGKTTLLKVLVKIAEYDSGEIIVNDSHELSSLSHRDWWEKLLYLNQESTLFPGSLVENVCLSTPFEKERFEQALHLALLDELLAERPDLYDCLSVENLSSGERQQVCLARMFYMKRDLILLDEATSALSPGREDAILHNMAQWAKQNECIILMVSHSRQIKEFCDDLIEIRREKGGEGV